MRQLTPKQQRFAEEYTKDCNGTQAAIRAGYSQRTANEQSVRLLANVSVKAEIERLLEIKAEETKADAAWIMKRLEKEATYDGEGASHSARVAALTTMSKCQGMQTDKLKIEGRIELADITEEERAKRIMILIRKYEIPNATDGTITDRPAITHEPDGSEGMGPAD